MSAPSVKRYTYLLLCLLVTGNLHAQDRSNLSLDLNFYPYLVEVKGDTDFTLNTAAQLPARFSYFSFINLGGIFNPGSVRFLVSEQNIRWTPAAGIPLDLVLQDTIRRGSENDTLQFGARWRVSSTGLVSDFFNALHLNYSVQFFVKRWDQRSNEGWQISHAYQMSFPYISERLYLSGFIDHNINENVPAGMTSNPVISESQMGFRLYEQLHFVAEYRVNQYRRSDTDNLAIGFEVKTRW